MPIDKSDYTRGRFITGAVLPVEDRRKAAVERGMFMTAPGGSMIVKRAPPLPSDLQEFEAAAREADKLAGIGYQEIQARLDQARAKLDELRTMVRRR